MLRITETPQPPRPAPAKGGNWLERLFSGPSGQGPALDLASLRDYLKTEDLEATARELHRLLPETREVRWPLEALDPFLSVEPKTTRARILIETLLRHSRAVISFADDSLSPREGAPDTVSQPRILLTLTFSLEPQLYQTP